MKSRFAALTLAFLATALWSPALAQVTRLDPSLELSLTSSAPVAILLTGSLQNQQQVVRRSLRIPPGPRASKAQAVAYRQNLAEEIRRETRPQQERLIQVLRQLGATDVEPFPLFNIIAAKLPGTEIPALLASPDILFVEAPGKFQTQSPVDVMALGGPRFWSAGMDGTGEAIAVLDTGIRASHLAFAGKQVYSYAFVEQFRNHPCLADNVDDPGDYNGHGTHVAAIAAGKWYENFSGVAPGVGEIYSYKVGVRTARGPAGCIDGGPFSEQGVLAALEHLVTETPVKIVNMSFGSPNAVAMRGTAYRLDRYASLFGISFLIAAGNSGPGNEPDKVFPVGSPSDASNGITVANVNTEERTDRSQYTLNPTSSRGPAADGGFKPDLAAPGTNYWSAGIADDSQLIQKTGTSMAAPALAGGVALLRSAGVTDWREVKAVLINSASNPSIFSSLFGRSWDRGWGYGYANLERAYQWKDFRFSDELSPVEPASFWRVPRNSGNFAATLVNQRQFTGELVPYINALSLSVFVASTGRRLDNSAQRNQVVQLVDANSDGDLIVRVAPQDPALFRQRNSPEPFAVALSTGGAQSVAPPRLQVNCTAPATIRVAASFDVACTVSNRGGLSLFSPRLTIPNVSTPTPASPLHAGAAVIHTFRLIAPAAPQATSIRIQVSANAYDQNYAVEQILPLRVEANPMLPSVSPSAGELNFTATVGSDPAPQDIRLSTTGTGISFATTSPASWITVSSSTNSIPANIRITVQSRNLSAGTYTSRINVALAGAADSNLVIPVTVRINAAASAPAVTFKDFAIAKSVTTSACVTPALTFNFTPQDSSVWLWFQSTNARRGDVVRYNWIAPNGSNYLTQTEPALTAEGNFCFWQRLALPTMPAAENLGLWSVQVTYNGAAINTSYFVYSQVTLVRSLITRSVPAGQGCPDPSAVSQLSRFDAQAVAWFLVSGAFSGDRASVRWISPSGATYQTSNFNPVPSAGSWCHSAVLSINGTAAASQPGAWIAVVMWNNSPISYEFFTITN